MNNAQKSFISSTFWTERVGPSAALKTLEVMQRTQSWKIISNKGKMFKKRLNELGKKYSLPINISEIMEFHPLVSKVKST